MFADDASRGVGDDDAAVRGGHRRQPSTLVQHDAARVMRAQVHTHTSHLVGGLKEHVLDVLRRLVEQLETARRQIDRCRKRSLWVDWKVLFDALDHPGYLTSCPCPPCQWC